MMSASSKSKIALLAALMAFAFAVTGCTKAGKTPSYDYMPHMNDSPALKAQGKTGDGYGMRVPPAGTIAQGQEIYHFAKDPAGASNMKNPIRRTKTSLLSGQHLYNTYCIVCHGTKGQGNGNVVPKFPMPPSLTSEKVANWKDGDIYHVITMGQNLMPSYASQLEPKERWAVVNYVRVLQRAMNPTQADIRELEQEKAANK